MILRKTWLFNNKCVHKENTRLSAVYSQISLRILLTNNRLCTIDINQLILFLNMKIINFMTYKIIIIVENIAVKNI